MTKSLTKIWLHGFKRLMTGLPKVQADYLRDVTKKQRKARADSVRSAKRRQAREAPESRVRPRAAAWAKGTWTRSYHSAPPMPGRLVNHLSYGLYVPPTRSTLQMPLVVMLHGCKQTIDEFAAGTRMNLVADAQGFAVVYPEQSKHAHAHRCWHWYDDRDSAGRGEARAIVSLIDELVEVYGFDPERVCVAGLSAGAGLASLLAIHYPERFAAVGLHSAPAFGEAHSGMTAMDVMRRGARHDPVALVDAAIDAASYPGMPAVIVQGDQDAVVAPQNAEQLAIEFLRANGLVDASGAPVSGTVRETREAGTMIRDYSAGGRRVVRLVRVADLGHAWAGGDDAIPFHSRKGPDASALMWEFFRYQRRRSRVVSAAVRRAAASGR
ncbi:poly(hydroxyalkanoate) depolymerase family esterase [Trinickia symbiotica]|uniref:Esterase n=1 Tax=Trinickia symbiotica TaxID=863227 RepID=A0A2N7X656_9BURK|nr:PHB depolymerase family esterase [Trinickia symbiotica]PMS37246.1 esterase [Trinickia symbiotica]PPK42683.1 poly(hydroxyalkanoate) depolymerase family esterase [Trinickia symbiotica]